MLATNTSSLPVTEIAVATARTPSGWSACTSSTRLRCSSSSRWSSTVITADDVFQDVKALAEKLDKNPVVVGDKAGFIANALLFGYLNHAVAMYESPLRQPRGHRRRYAPGLRITRWARWQLMDLIGLDTAYEILDTMYKQGRDRLHAPSAADQADGQSAGLLGPQERSGLLQVCRARLAPTSCADAHTPAETGAPEPAWTCGPVDAVGVVGSRARWPPASSRSFATARVAP